MTLRLTNQVNKQSSISSTDVIQLPLTLKMTTAQFVETSVTVNLDDKAQPTYDHFLSSGFADSSKV